MLQKVYTVVEQLTDEVNVMLLTGKKQNSYTWPYKAAESYQCMLAGGYR